MAAFVGPTLGWGNPPKTGAKIIGPLASAIASEYAHYGDAKKFAAAKKKYLDDVAPFKKSIKDLENRNARLQATIRRLEGAKALAEANGEPFPANLQAELTKAKDEVKTNNDAIERYKAKWRARYKKWQDEQITNSYVAPSDSSSNGKDTNPQPGKGPFYFNAPLVAEPNYLPLSELPVMLPAGPIKGNAANFWASSTTFDTVNRHLEIVRNGGKGAFQMDRLTNTLELKANAKKTATERGLPFDDKMYGFKFQYNPTTVNMNWQGIMGANPVYEMLGNDPAVPMSTNLFGGTLTFDLILNRIQDIALLRTDGTFKYGQNPYGVIDVSEADRKQIVEKGTMYDLEYLFRTLHGYAFFTNFTSNLMGTTTNDPGWLPVRPVELHLGNKLRYRVRVSGLEVVHKIFSERMIPILSVVTITCSRYWDGPSDKKSLGAK